MHYMPWFENPETLGPGQWGYHWTLNNQNPNVVGPTGKRQIASHYYPKIGLYASSDPDVIEYHLLLMKIAGVDGVLIDWYGVEGTNGDIASLLDNSNALVDQVDDFGLEFAIVLEDRFAGSINQTKANLAYLRDNYFNKPEYIRIGPGNDPLLPVFGPITWESPSQWTQILAQAGEDVEFLPLWYESADAGSNATGEYAWIFEDEELDNYQSHLISFYENRAPIVGTVGAVAYPGFVDFYEEGGVGDIIPFEIPHDEGHTLANTLALASQYGANYDFLQLATWNDFGEGTIFEPTVETGFDYLLQLQQFTGVPYGEPELQLVFDLYRARKEFGSDATIQLLLDQASSHLNSLQIVDARSILESIYPPGDFDDSSIADSADFLQWQRQAGSVGYYPLNTLAADGNADGVVDGKDLSLWEATYSQALQANTTSVPEPNAGVLFVLACCLCARVRTVVS